MKWSGAAATVLLLVVWVGSACWHFGFFLEPTGGMTVHAGRVRIGWDEPWSIVPVGGWSLLEPRSYTFDWWFDGWRGTIWSGATRTYVFIPIWVLVLLFATPTLWLWRCDRRRQPGLCIKCGYDLRGADHKVCPECGSGVLAVDK